MTILWWYFRNKRGGCKFFSFLHQWTPRSPNEILLSCVSSALFHTQSWWVFLDLYKLLFRPFPSISSAELGRDPFDFASRHLSGLLCAQRSPPNGGVLGGSGFHGRTDTNNCWAALLNLFWNWLNTKSAKRFIMHWSVTSFYAVALAVAVFVVESIFLTLNIQLRYLLLLNRTKASWVSLVSAIRAKAKSPLVLKCFRIATRPLFVTRVAQSPWFLTICVDMVSISCLLQVWSRDLSMYTSWQYGPLFDHLNASTHTLFITSLFDYASHQVHDLRRI